ncbi:MAG: VacJ family lipoprotein [Hyphomonadaceae bacterium]
MRRLGSILFALAALSACATGGQNAAATPGDPFEGWNRNVYAFNDAVDRYALGPTSDVYRTLTPGFARAGVGNVLSNLASPVVLVNDVLQGQPSRAFDTTSRFAINTTIGVLGLWDAAEYFGIEGHKEDFGQTLAVWGVEDGPYLMLPFLGPSTPRDAFGRIVDTALDPLNWTEFSGQEDLDDQIALGRGILGTLNARVAVDDQIETLRAQTEPYVALRRLYLSQREAAIRNGAVEENPYEDLPDFDEFLDEEDTGTGLEEE